MISKEKKKKKKQQPSPWMDGEVYLFFVEQNQTDTHRASHPLIITFSSIFMVLRVFPVAILLLVIVAAETDRTTTR